jgi:MoxR-like ATPase
MNLLPFDSLRFLQGIVDGKPSFEYKGQTVNIKDGFQIIGTMNLVVNGTTYSLPEPLVDRCEETKKFNLTENDLFKVLYK